MNIAFENDICIEYTSHNFPNSNIRPWGVLQTSWNQILWAAITIGRPNTAHVFQHGKSSYYEAVFRLSLVRMALAHGGSNGPVRRTDAFRFLDPTEKGAVSYFLGMAICKLFASRLLNTPWLLHLDVFRNQLNPVALGGRSRPDLIGQDHIGAWHAFESKGRSSVPNSDDKNKAKIQAQRLVFVNSKRCSLNIGAISYFKNDKLEFYWCDPEPEEPEKLEPIMVHVPEEAWSTYYEPALSLAGESTSHRSTDDHTALDVDVKIHPEIREFLLGRNWNTARKIAVEMRTDFIDQGFHPDGLKVSAGDSWRQPFKSESLAL